MQQYRTTQIQHCLDQLLRGEQPARDALIEYAYERMRVLTRKLLAGYPSVGRWERTDDVLHKAAVRLWKSLEEVQPDNVRKFFALAALQIRRELIDSARHYYGPHGHGSHVPQLGPSSEDTGGGVTESTDPHDGPRTLSDWTELHETVQALPDELREVFDLLYYHGLTKPQAAEVLGISLSTLKRRWMRARQALYTLFHDSSDGSP